MPVYDLGPGADRFDSEQVPDWTNDSVVLGGGGRDDITARALSPTFDARLFVAGGRGRDTIVLDASNSFAFGEGGADTLVAQGGLGNRLDGGNGADVLISLGGGSGMFEGNTLTGGRGRDTYTFNNPGNLVVELDASGDGVVSEGDRLRGPMDLITDYRRGEFLGLRAFDRVESAGLIVDPLDPDRFRPELGDGQHAVFRGDYAGDGAFVVAEEGSDLLVLYDALDFEDEPIAQGSLVLLGVTNPDILSIG
jgi:Ca2+-binding RTX toxin-like protein